MSHTSIIPGIVLLLLVWIAHARLVWNNKDAENSALQPIVSQSHRTRICTELCTSGLGGIPCGDTCFDLIPDLPISEQQDAVLSLAQQQDDSQSTSEKSISSSSGKRYIASTRSSSCDVLCKNRLGYPLCGCTYDDTKIYDTNYLEVCSSFCVNFGYQLYGCQNCTVYTKYLKESSANSAFDMASLNVGGIVGVNWTGWCRTKCSDGHGGAACNCDLLP